MANDDHVQPPPLPPQLPPSLPGHPPAVPEPPPTQSSNPPPPTLQAPPQPSAWPPTQPPALPPAPGGSGGWGWVLVLLVLAGGGGWWYQQREDAATTDETEVAASAAVGKETVLVDARPWGRIENVVATGTDEGSGAVVALPAGSPFTPRSAALPVGAYEITLSHPDAGSQTCNVDVRSGTPSTCEVVFFEADARAYFKELGW